jgi:sugar/nucleoside kinase (ribokinase family)
MKQNTDNTLQTLVIGSTVVDVLLSIPSIPKRGEDVNIKTSEYRIGGCAYNVFMTMRLFESPAVLCSPVGSGLYGSMVKKHLEGEGIKPFVSLDGENGCCYCLVEPDGERSFLSLHGVEYLFSRSWVEGFDISNTDSVFICGLEVEDTAGDEIIDFVYEHTELELYFAPGPRIKYIPGERMDKLLSRRDNGGKGPFIHLNEIEALRYSGKHKLEDGAEFLAAQTGNSVVVTLGERGCYFLSKTKAGYVPGFPVGVIDTVGAGDAHYGALISCLKMGMDLADACKKANRIGATVVGIPGAVPDKLPSL